MLFLKQKHNNKVRWLWFIFVITLLMSIAAEFLFEAHGHFIINGTFGFNVWYGLVTCIIMIFVAKFFGIFLKRKDNYYVSPKKLKNNQKSQTGETL